MQTTISPTIKNPHAHITFKQKKFLQSLIKKKYASNYPTQQQLIEKIERMRVGEASDAIKKLLGQ